MNRLFLIAVTTLALCGVALAQERTKIETSQPIVQTDRVFVSKGHEAAMMQSWERLPEGKVSFFAADLAEGGDPVKNSPYSASAVSESTQTLADGNRITSKSTAFVARDSQGRTRREQSFDHLGSLNMEGNKVIFISDPAARTDFILNPEEKNARVVKRDNMKIMIVGNPEKTRHEFSSADRATIAVKRIHKEEGEQKFTESPEQVKREALGSQVIEGVSAEGTRETVTIPAGTIGNDRPIEIVSENWYSADLHTMVLRKHSDPRFGESTFRLTNISRAEPDPSLFQVPAGFKTSTEPALQELRRQRLPKD
jgi:hypothetical protein